VKDGGNALEQRQDSGRKLAEKKADVNYIRPKIAEDAAET
jgi:hypothetical protein